MSLNPTQLAFIQLRAEGKTLQGIAQQLNRSVSTMGDWNYYYRDEIQVARRDWLCKTFMTDSADQLNYCQQLVQKVRDALNQQDFNTLSTKELFTMLTALMAEQSTIIYRKW